MPVNLSGTDFATIAGNIDFNFTVPDIDDEPKPVKRKESVPIYTADLETDPFEYGRYPKPFAADLFDGEKHTTFWGDDCTDKLCSYIEQLPPGFIFIHNGGRFDIYYLMKLVRGNPALIINGRIVRTFCKSASPSKPHEIRDSYAIMPFALAKYKKDDIDYRLMEKETREKHREKICEYLRGDTTYLHELCVAFLEMFGNKVTIGSASMKELMRYHQFECLSKKADAEIRDDYYYGGRVQYFARGILKGPWKVYDVNSMYPFVMKSFLHPVSMPGSTTTKVRTSTCFLKVQGKNYGAFPQRTKKGLRFDIEDGTFTVSRHEWDAAIEHDLFVPTKIIECINFPERANFATFVDTYYARREKAKIDKDEMHGLFYKYVLNSAYGKFAQNSEKYMEYCITDQTTNLTTQGWKPYEADDITQQSGYLIWRRKPVNTNAYAELRAGYNVATGASITGASRSLLIRAIANADTPIYCDTDSIICRNLAGVDLDGKKLGAWKEECTATQACIGGKKLYVLFGKECPECKGTKSKPQNTKQGRKCEYSFHKYGQVKQANKGVNITPIEIRAVCEGQEVTSTRIAPSFHLDGTATFIKRRVKMT